MNKTASENSKMRALASGKTVGKALVEEAAGALMPGGKLAAKGAIALTEQLLQLIGNRRSEGRWERVESLFHAIANESEEPLSYEEVLQLAKEDPTAMFDSILDAHLADEEAEKAPIYGRFYRGLLESRFPERKEHLKFLKAVKALTRESIDLLREEVRKEEDYRRRRAKGEDVPRASLRGRETESPFEVQQLIAFGLFDARQGTKAPHANERGKQLILGLWPCDAWGS